MELQVSEILQSVNEVETKYFLPHLKHCQRYALLVFFWYCIGNKHEVQRNSSGESSIKGIFFLIKLTKMSYSRTINSLSWLQIKNSNLRKTIKGKTD